MTELFQFWWLEKVNWRFLFSSSDLCSDWWSDSDPVSRWPWKMTHWLTLCHQCVIRTVVVAAEECSERKSRAINLCRNTSCSSLPWDDFKHHRSFPSTFENTLAKTAFSPHWCVCVCVWHKHIQRWLWEYVKHSQTYFWSFPLHLS